MNKNNRFSFGTSDSSAARFAKLFIPITASALLILFIVSTLFYMFSGRGITKSTVERTPIHTEHYEETGFYTDMAGAVESAEALERGMTEFFDETGVKPYLYVADGTSALEDIVGTEYDDESFMEALYEHLFDDGGHFLVLYNIKSEQWNYYSGSDAALIMDDEAVKIFGDYIAKQKDTTDDFSEFVSDVFINTSKRIMTKTTLSDDIDSGLLIGVIVAALLAAIFAVSIIQSLKYSGNTHDAENDTYADYNLRDR